MLLNLNVLLELSKSGAVFESIKSNMFKSKRTFYWLKVTDVPTFLGGWPYQITLKTINYSNIKSTVYEVSFFGTHLLYADQKCDQCREK